MGFLSSTDRNRALQAIRAAEAKTAGEFVVALARESDSYQSGPLLVAAIIALTLPNAALLFGPHLTAEAVGFSVHALAQLGLFALVFAICSWSPIRVRLAPRALRARRVRRAALDHFFTEGVHGAHSRSGILLYVSLAEHQVELVADIGIDTRVKPGAWDGVIADFVSQVKRGEMGHGLAAAITGIGDILAEHFPPEPGQSNELPDRLIEL
jgi:putative membrane protein